mmetsp:Transcript_65482/g.152012  ORF Transcript_65482/g.152012 Transcript_65482/m.152012 type:complete len:245 (-) Transcript_65482:1583-2317(-)
MSTGIAKKPTLPIKKGSWNTLVGSTSMHQEGKHEGSKAEESRKEDLELEALFRLGGCLDGGNLSGYHPGVHSPQTHPLLLPLRLELLDDPLPLHPVLEPRVSLHRVPGKADHTQSIVEHTIHERLWREEGCFRLVLVCVRGRPHVDAEWLLARCLRWDLGHASRHPLAVNLHDAGLALALPALVPDEHIRLRRHLAQGLSHPPHGHDVRRLEDDGGVAQLLVALEHRGWLLLLWIINLGDLGED